MAELTMNQVIHAAVRRDVTRTEQALRALPDGDRARAKQIQAGWAHLVGQLKHHHESEDALVWPYLRSVGTDEALSRTADDIWASDHAGLVAELRLPG